MEEKLINIAKSLLGRPYKYGAQISEAPKYFDCSLFIQYVFGKIRIELPRTAIEQAMVGKKVAINKIKEGDVIFLKGEIGRYNKYFPQGIGHAGIYIGDNKVIHASSRRLGNELKNIYNSKLIKEKGGVVITDLKKFIKRGEPLIIIKRYF